MPKQLRLITRFAELRQGMDVIDLMCECGHVHEATCVELIEYEGRENRPAEGVAWRCEPDCLERPPNHFLGIDAQVVEQHRIFAVVNGPSLGNQIVRRKADAR